LLLESKVGTVWLRLLFFAACANRYTRTVIVLYIQTGDAKKNGREMVSWADYKSKETRIAKRIFGFGFKANIRPFCFSRHVWHRKEPGQPA